MSPTRLLADHGLVDRRTTLVHATHLSDEDIALIGAAGATVSLCPTTERDLGDGVGPGRRLVDAGARLSLGSDSHAVIDLFEEMRAVELDERLVSQRRGHWAAGDLVRAATTDGHASRDGRRRGDRRGPARRPGHGGRLERADGRDRVPTSTPSSSPPSPRT